MATRPRITLESILLEAGPTILRESNWLEDSKKKNKRDIGLTSLYINGVGVSWLFGEAMKRAGKDLNPDSLKSAMETLSNYETGGIFPPVNFSSESHAPAEMVKFFKADLTNKRLNAVTDWRKPKKMP